MAIYLSVLSRCGAAIAGGYGIATLFSVATLCLPVAPAEAVLAGMVWSFLIYTAVIIWVFAVRSAWRAWLGIGVLALCLSPAALWVWFGAEL